MAGDAEKKGFFEDINLLDAGLAIAGGLGIMGVVNWVKGWFVNEEEQGFFGSLLGGVLSLGALVGGAFLLYRQQPANAISNLLDKEFSRETLETGATRFTAREGGDLTDDEKQQILDLIPAAQRESISIDTTAETITVPEGVQMPEAAMAKSRLAAAAAPSA